MADILLKNKNYTNGGMPMNEKLVINANLLRKETEFCTRVCVVEKAEAVTHEKFERLKRHPMQDNDLIAENTDLMHDMLRIFQMQNCFTKIICKRICRK